MALLGTFVDSRTLATIATSGSATFAHGISGGPDFVIIQPEGTAVASSASIPHPLAQFDATNVTVYNAGQANVGGVTAYRVISIKAHSIIR